MKYIGTDIIIQLEDSVSVDELQGVIVCIFDEQEYGEGFYKEDWSIYKEGILINTASIGLLMVNNISDISFISRAEKNK